MLHAFRNLDETILASYNLLVYKVKGVEND